MTFLKNKRDFIRYSAVWIVLAFLQALSIYFVVSIPFALLLVDAIVHVILFALTSVIVWNVIQYGNYENFPQVQRLVNYGVLALLYVALCAGFGYAVSCLLFDSEIAHKLGSVLPVYVFTALLIYMILVLYFKSKVLQYKLNKTDENITENVESENQKEVIKPVSNSEILERIAVKSGQKINVVLVSDIFYLQADGDYVHIFTNDGKYLKEQTMKYFEDCLPAQFVRVHRSYIVNIEFISRIELYKKQNQLLTLKNGYRIKVSIAGYKLLKSKLGL